MSEETVPMGWVCVRTETATQPLDGQVALVKVHGLHDDTCISLLLPELPKSHQQIVAEALSQARRIQGDRFSRLSIREITVVDDPATITVRPVQIGRVDYIVPAWMAEERRKQSK